MSAPVPTSAAPAGKKEVISQRFQNIWTVRSNFQRGTICSAAVSPAETSLVSSSLDSTILFIDVKTGQLFGVLDFEARFHASSLLWVSESLFYAGCSNGVAFAVGYYPGTKTPITMRPILQHFNLPIIALAFNPIRNFLAVGCGGDVYIFSRPLYGDLEAWELIDHLPSPVEGHEGRLTSLEFYGRPTQRRQLFIGHAKAGFCIWQGPHDYQRTPYEADSNICTIGDAALLGDGSFITIATLEHWVVVYPMGENGPNTQQRYIVQTEEAGSYRPIVPIALRSNNLAMKGTTSGKVHIIDLTSNGELAPIRNDPQEVVRTLTACGDKLIVGLSDANGKMSKVKCFQDLASSPTLPPRIHHDSDQPLFAIAVGDLEDLAGSYRTIDGLKFRKLDRLLKSLLTQFLAALSKRLRSRRVWTTMFSIWLFTLMLVVDPPPLPGHTVNNIFQATEAPQASWNRPKSEPALSVVPMSGRYAHGGGFMMREDSMDDGGKATFATAGYGAQLPSQGEHIPTGVPHGQSADKRSKYPALGSLFSYCGRFVIWRLTCWGSWFLVFGTIMVGYFFTGIFYVLCIVPFLLQRAWMHIPGLMVVALCEVLQAFGNVPICPK
ncbi:hypothetical protein FRC09_010282 [Ceratobasidium sp. 395]|nr:hypothetical protein FRC09_010282 [Ceratobasidium sp. 395]